MVSDNFGVVSADLCFCEAHWIFAWHYFKVAHEMTNKDSAESKSKKKEEGSVTGYWIGIFVNAIFPICEGVFGYVVYYYFNETHTYKKWAGTMFSLSMIGTSISQMTTCALYFYSLLRIKNFIEGTRQAEEIDVKTMLVHASAFVLYLASILVFTISYVVYLARDFNTKVSELYYASVAQFIISFISQCFLCYIFSKLSVEDSEPSERMLTIEV